MTNKAEEAYFCWLAINNFGEEYFTTHYRLLSILYDCDFIPIVENDINRVVDGIQLRDEFKVECPGYSEDLGDLGEHCNVLELMVALAQKMVFYGGYDTRYWLKQMMENLGFREDDFSDDVYDLYGGDSYVIDTVDIFVNRQYDENGHGGLFPLENPGVSNQREVELWYQMQAYIIERM